MNKPVKLRQSKRRFIFPMIGMVVAGMTLIFGLFITETIKQSILKDIHLDEHEYKLFINDINYKESETNYYQSLKNVFDKVIPFNTLNTEYEDKYTYIIGTNLDDHKILFENRFYDITIDQVDANTLLPSVIYLKDSNDIALNTVIELDGISYEVVGYFEADTKYQYIFSDKQIFMMSPEAFGTLLPDYISDESGDTIYYFENYYIYSDLGNDATIDTVGQIYDVSLPWLYVESYQSILINESSRYNVFQGLTAVFFILVTLFLSINMMVSVNLTLRERKKFYSILVVLGMKLNHLTLMIIKENAVISLFTTLISFILGLIIYSISLLTQPRMIFTMIPIDQLIIGLGLIYLIPVLQAFVVTRFIRYRSLTNENFY